MTGSGEDGGALTFRAAPLPIHRRYVEVLAFFAI